VPSFLKTSAGLTGTLHRLKRKCQRLFLPNRYLDRAQAKREEIERELRRCPDFQLYLITKSPKEQARMQRLLMQIPAIRLWRT
jgi:hypothetical protein